MFLAPLNYDRFFKKIFSDIDIAKRFLEDFLEVKIDHIENLEKKHKVTDDAAVVEFDYRCQVDNKYIIVDMQQWYKSDVVRRFYLYHAINTGLQLEKLPEKIVALDIDNRKGKKQKDYSYIEPVITLIWMVDDTLDFKENIATYSMNHEAIIQFIHNEKIWGNEGIVALLEEREKVLGLLNNDAKSLSFIAKNKLIFMFQKNIVNNLSHDETHKKYTQWFEFASLSRKKGNKEADFEKFKQDKIFIEMIKRLSRDSLQESDLDYIENEEEFLMLVQKYNEEIETKAIARGIEKGIEKGRLIEKKQTEARLKQEKKQAEARLKQDKIEMIKKMLLKNISIDDIADFTGVSTTDISLWLE